MSKVKDRLEFTSFDGELEVQVGQGDHCVLLSIRPSVSNSTGPRSGIVLTDDEAEALGRSLVRRARYSRRPVI